MLAIRKSSFGVSERVSVGQLKKRFVGYKVKVGPEEECGWVLLSPGGPPVLESPTIIIEIVVSGLFGTDKKSTDPLGNAVGSFLKNAVGPRARCVFES